MGGERKGSNNTFLTISDYDAEQLRKKEVETAGSFRQRESGKSTEAPEDAQKHLFDNYTMNKNEDFDFIIEKKVTNTVGAEVYRDVKRLIKLFFKGIIAIVVIFIVYISYSDFVHEKQRKAAQLELDKQRAVEAQQRKQAELARRIDLPIAWNGSDKWRQGMRSWGNSGFVFTSNQFILNIDSKRLSKEQIARIQGKKVSCYMDLLVGDYREGIAGDFGYSLDDVDESDPIHFTSSKEGYVSNDMFLYVDLDIIDADKKARNFDSWDLKCGDLVSKVEYNKKGN